jgi:hypothetical protein
VGLKTLKSVDRRFYTMQSSRAFVRGGECETGKGACNLTARMEERDCCHMRHGIEICRPAFAAVDARDS